MHPAQLAKSGSEHSHQRALFAWANCAERYGLWFANHVEAYTDQQWREQYMLGCDGIPQLKWLHAIHNQGHGDAVRGGKAKAEGVKPGVADMFLPARTIKQTTEFNDVVLIPGLYIELKKLTGGTTSKEQLDFKSYVEAQGYRHEICKGWKASRDVIIAYLGLTAPADAL